MTSTDRPQNLEMALEAVLRDLHAAEADLASASFRVHHAREAAVSLQALVGAARASRIAEEVGVALPQRRTQTAGVVPDAVRRAAIERRRAAEAEAEAEAERARRAEQEAPASAPHEESVVEANLRRMLASRGDTDPGADVDVASPAVDDPSSTERVIQLLKEYEGKAIPRAMILQEFEKRGWIDPSWSHPGPAIRMAIRRATEKGAAKVVGDGRYTYADPGLLGEVASGGDA